MRFLHPRGRGPRPCVAEYCRKSSKIIENHQKLANIEKSRVEKSMKPHFLVVFRTSKYFFRTQGDFLPLRGPLTQKRHFENFGTPQPRWFYLKFWPSKKMHFRNPGWGPPKNRNLVLKTHIFVRYSFSIPFWKQETISDRIGNILGGFADFPIFYSRKT